MYLCKLLKGLCVSNLLTEHRPVQTRGRCVFEVHLEFERKTIILSSALDYPSLQLDHVIKEAEVRFKC